MIVLYSNNCPRCKILKEKLDGKGVKYTICNDYSIMENKKFLSVPILEVDNKTMTFNEAIKWLKEKTNE